MSHTSHRTVAHSVTCRQVALWTSDDLDGRLDASVSSIVAQHLAVCPPCRVYREQIRLVRDTIRVWPRDRRLPRNQAELRMRFVTEFAARPVPRGTPHRGSSVP